MIHNIEIKREQVKFTDGRTEDYSLFIMDKDVATMLYAITPLLNKHGSWLAGTAFSGNIYLEASFTMYMVFEITRGIKVLGDKVKFHMSKEDELIIREAISTNASYSKYLTEAPVYELSKELLNYFKDTKELLYIESIPYRLNKYTDNTEKYLDGFLKLNDGHLDSYIIRLLLLNDGYTVLNSTILGVDYSHIDDDYGILIIVEKDNKHHLIFVNVLYLKPYPNGIEVFKTYEKDTDKSIVDTWIKEYIEGLYQEATKYSYIDKYGDLEWREDMPEKLRLFAYVNQLEAKQIIQQGSYIWTKYSYPYTNGKGIIVTEKYLEILREKFPKATFVEQRD